MLRTLVEYRRREKGKALKVLGCFNIKGIKGMVCNILKILDEGQIKMCPECKMGKPKYVYDFEYQILKYKHDLMKAEFDKNNMIISTARGQCYKYPHKQSDYEEACLKYNTLYNNVFFQKWLMEYEMNRNAIPKIFWDCKEICNFMNVIPFTPSVMINISPDWKDNRCNKTKIKILKFIIDSYMKEGWYDKWEYVIENGSDGTHIHAHIVAHMNVERLKSVETHLRKGNHFNQIKKYAKKCGSEGMEGIIKGSGVQKTFLRTQELVDDKLKYLQEEHKPEGHKNLSVIEDGYVSGCL